MKLAVATLLMLLVISALPGCSGESSEDTGIPITIMYEGTEIPVTTEFGRMLGFVPYAYLEEQDIWYSDLAQAKKVHGMEGVTSIEEAAKLPEAEREALLAALKEIIQPTWMSRELAPVVGFDGMTIDRIMFSGIIPAKSFSISEGCFDEELINDKLAELGYDTAEHGAHTYYTKGEDCDINKDELSGIVLNSMNRLTVLNDTIVTAPSTEKVTAIMDTIADNERSIIDTVACRALADSLGEVLAAVITTPYRVTDYDQNMEVIPSFYYTIPEDWGRLHRYDYSAIGYMNDGEERTLTISLFYASIGSAQDDGDELVKRMESYSLGTQYENVEKIPLTDWVDIGEPIVRDYPYGATLTVSCRVISEKVDLAMFLGAQGTSDTLFLEPDPAQHVIAE